MSDAVRDLFMSVGFEGAAAIKGLEGVNKKADETKEAINGIGETAGNIGASFETQMSGLDKGFKLWETNAGKFTTTLEKKQKRIEVLKNKTGLLEKEIGKTNGEMKEAVKKYGEGSEAAKKLENQLLDLKIQQAEYNKELKTLNSFNWDGLDKIGTKCTKIGGVMTAAVTTPIVGIGTAGVKTFIELEDAFAGVEKTVDATGPELDALREKLNSLVTDKGIPVKVTEMYGIAEAAGQLGIQMENIEGFSEVMAKLGTATNMTSEQAATDLARFANIVQMPQENFDRLGATIVELGNNLATTESEITSMALRLGSAGKQIGLTESDIFGFAGALSSVGIEAEAGGSAFSKVMIEMQNAVMDGGDSLEIFAAITGRTVEEFGQAFKQDASSALIDFTEGLGALQKEGFNTNTILDELGFSDIRVGNALRAAAGSGDLFREAMSMGNKAWEENSALNEEAEKKYEKTAAKIEVFKNKLTLLSEKIGGDLSDKFNGLLDIGTKVVDWLSNLDSGTRKTVIGIAGIAASIGPLFLGLGAGIKAIKGIRSVITDLGKGMKIIKTAFSSGGKAIGFLTSPIGMTILAIGALIAIGIVLYKNWDKISAWLKDKFPETFDKISGVVSKFKEFLSSHMDSFKGIFKGLTDFLDGILLGNFEKAFGGLKDIFSNVGNILQPFVDAFKEKFPEAFNFAAGIFNFFENLITENIGNIEGILDGFKDCFIGIFTGDFDKIFGGIEKIICGICGILESLIAPLQDKFPNVFNFLSEEITNFKTMASNVMGSVKDIFNGITEYISGVFSGNWSQALNGLGAILKGVFDLMKNIVTGALNSIFGLFEMLIAPLQEKFPFAFDIMSGALNIFKDTVFSEIGNVQQIFNGLIDFVVGVFTGDWGRAWQGVKDVFGGIFSTLADLVKAPLNLVIGIINKAIQGINDKIKIQIPDWSPLFGGKELGFNIPTIPMLAKGTDYHFGGPAIVGEEGPEIVNLNRGDTVTPNDKTNRILAGLGRKNRRPEPAGSAESLSGGDAGNFRIQPSGMMAKIEVIIEKIIIGGEVTNEKAESLKKQVKEIFKEAWEDAWYELCLKYPNLTEI